MKKILLLLILIILFSFPLSILAEPGDAGAICSTNSDCLSNQCQPFPDGSKFCTAPAAGNPNVPAPVTQNPKDGPGATCNGDSDCQSDSCLTVPNGGGKVCAGLPEGNQIVNPANNNGSTTNGTNGTNAPAGGPNNSGNLLSGLRTIIGGNKQVQQFGTLGSLISSILDLVFLLAGFLMFIWAFVGIFQYITAGGNKEGLAKARARITWAIIGFVFVMVAFLISGYVQQLIAPKKIQFCSNSDIANCESQTPPKTCVEVGDSAQCQ